jgi:Zn-finger nucleic acid-binding protein
VVAAPRRRAAWPLRLRPARQPPATPRRTHHSKLSDAASNAPAIKEGEIVTDQAGTTTTLVCPKCQAAMRSYERSGITIDQCTQCRGIFLDRGELERLIDAEAAYGAGEPTQEPELDWSAEGHRGGYRQGGYRGKRRRRGFLGEMFGDD